MRKHANLKSKIPAFMAPYKFAEFATFALLETRGKLFFFTNSRLLKVTPSEEVYSIRDVSNFVKLS